MLGDMTSSFAMVAGPIKEPEDVAALVIEAVADERFLILTDPIAQTWMGRKSDDIERWLDGMRRVQQRMEAMDAGSTG